MKYHVLVSLKKYLRLSSAAVLMGTLRVNSLITEKQTTKFSSANFQRMLCPSYILIVCKHEPPRQDLHCFQIHLFSSLVVKELIEPANCNTLGPFSEKIQYLKLLQKNLIAPAKCQKT